MATTKKKTVSSPARARKAAGPHRATAKAVVPTAAATPAKHADPAAPAAAAAKADKPRKVKVLRDSFTMPKTEYAVLEALKQRASEAGRPAKKSELLRAGVRALAEMGDTAFLSALSAVPAIKTGRPAKG